MILPTLVESGVVSQSYQFRNDCLLVGLHVFSLSLSLSLPVPQVVVKSSFCAVLPSSAESPPSTKQVGGGSVCNCLVGFIFWKGRRGVSGLGRQLAAAPTSINIIQKWSASKQDDGLKKTTQLFRNFAICFFFSSSLFFKSQKKRPTKILYTNHPVLEILFRG